MTCRAVRGWLVLASDRLADPERLVLEEHLQACARCRSERAHLVFVRRVAGELPRESIGPRGHARAIAAALMRGRTAALERTSRRRWWYAVPAVAIVIAIAVMVWRRDRAELASIAEPTASAPTATPALPRVPPPRSPERAVASGELLLDEKLLRSGDEVPASARLRTTAVARLNLHGVHVVIGAASEVVVRSDRSILLERGTLELDGAVEVHTPKFAARLDGAAAIALDSVTVARGTMWVEHLGTAKRLDAGASWRVEEPRSDTPRTPPVVPPKDAKPEVSRPSAPELLARAHLAYRNGAFAEARREATLALALPSTRTHAAEAHTIVADALQALGELPAAFERYEAIATRYAELAAGETALFAAARLASRVGRDARELYTRYLARYPSGRFVEDAKRATREKP